MTTARRWTLYGPRDLRLEEVDLTAPATGQVLVQTTCSAVSVASELSLYLGRAIPERWPQPLGYQSVGQVVGIGPDMPTTWLGVRVVGTWGHTSHALLPAERLISVPAPVSDSTALAVILGEESLKGVRKLNLPPGSEVLVVGAGLLGLLSVFNLTRLGHRAHVSEPRPERQALARQFGAAGVWRPGEFSSHPFLFALECSASPEGFHELQEHMQPGGRVVVLSDGNWGALALSPAFHRRELTVIASSDGDDYASYARWLWKQADPGLARLFGSSVPASALADTFPLLRDSRTRPVSLRLDWTR